MKDEELIAGDIICEVVNAWDQRGTSVELHRMDRAVEALRQASYDAHLAKRSKMNVTITIDGACQVTRERIAKLAHDIAALTVSKGGA